MSSTTAKAKAAAAAAGPTTPALSYDEILDAGVLAEETVPLCLNGRIRRQYEDVKRRIEGRTADWEANREAEKLVLKARNTIAARAVAEASADDRLVTKAPEPEADPEAAADEAYVDEEQPELDRLKAEMLRWTVPFVLRAVPEADWSALLEAHPPRKSPDDVKKIDLRDAEDGVDTSTFYHALIRAAIAEPPHTDDQFAKLMRLVTAAQFERLKDAAARVNLRDDNLPFSPGDLESRRR
jgi:hypothetical protein